MNFRTALLCSIIAEPYRDKKKRPKPFTPDDFMPKPRKSMKGEQMAKRMEKINTILRGKAT